MIIKPLSQLIEMVASGLSSMTSLSNSFQSFIVEPMPNNSQGLLTARLAIMMPWPSYSTPLSSVNLARAYARQEVRNLSVGATKTLLHIAAMVDRFIAMSAKHANLRYNNTDFKELLFYGVRAVM